MEYHSVITKSEILPCAAMWVDVETVVLNEVREEEISYNIAFMRNLKRNDANAQNRNRLADLREQNFHCQGGRMRGRDS